MRMFLLSVTLAGILAGTCSAQAQTNNKSYVASYGNNNNSCTRSAPCATFQGAFDKTIAGGEIICLDLGDFLGLQISHSVTVNCKGSDGGPATSGIGAAK